MARKCLLLLCGLCLLGLTGCAVYGDQPYHGRHSWPPDEPREVVLIPRSQVYFVPNFSFSLFFYNGYWWAHRHNRWYRSSSHSGPWAIISWNVVPGPVYHVPRDYEHRYREEKHVPFREFGRQHGYDGGGERDGRDDRGGPGGPRPGGPGPGPRR